MSIQAEQTPAVIGASFKLIDLIKSAMRAAHVLAAGEEPPGNDANDAAVIANQMLDSWNADKLAIFTNDTQDFTLVSGKQTYTLGPGGDFDTLRPAEIERASIVILTNPGVPNEQPIALYSEQEWQEIAIKGTLASWPNGVYADGAMPLQNLGFWPIPTDANKFRMYSWQRLTQFTDLTQPLIFPPGYQEALKYNLAIRIAAEWPGELTQALLGAAQQSLAVIRSFNVEPGVLKCDPMFTGADDGSDYRSQLFNIP